MLLHLSGDLVPPAASLFTFSLDRFLPKLVNEADNIRRGAISDHDASFSCPATGYGMTPIVLRSISSVPGLIFRVVSIALLRVKVTCLGHRLLVERFRLLLGFIWQVGCRIAHIELARHRVGDKAGAVFAQEVDFAAGCVDGFHDTNSVPVYRSENSFLLTKGWDGNTDGLHRALRES